LEAQLSSGVPFSPNENWKNCQRKYEPPKKSKAVSGAFQRVSQSVAFLIKRININFKRICKERNS
jgi:hypothetical protein